MPSLRDSTNVLDRLQFRVTMTGISDICVERRNHTATRSSSPGHTAACRLGSGERYMAQGRCRP